MNRSPLRYPGGKSRVSNFVAKLIRDNNIVNGNYVEPFAGGAGVALNLLFDSVVDDIYINDKDRSIYAFWYSILEHTDEFIKKVASIELTVEEWKRQRTFQFNKENASSFDLGFSTFYLNRVNRSGIIMAGLIGGLSQSGKWKMDVRFNRSDLINRITEIAKKKTHIHLTNLDAIEFLNTTVSVLDKKNTLIYLDPPYYDKGSKLYMNFFKHEDHANLRVALSKLEYLWLVSYDNQQEIKDIYAGEKIIEYPLWYSAGPKHEGAEVMFGSEKLQMDENMNPLFIKKIA